MVSRALCMARRATPISMVRIGVRADAMDPRVDPPLMSLRFTNSWQGIPLAAQRPFTMATASASPGIRLAAGLFQHHCPWPSLGLLVMSHLSV